LTGLWDPKSLYGTTKSWNLIVGICFFWDVQGGWFFNAGDDTHRPPSMYDVLIGIGIEGTTD
jgi:hypothetical protein